MRTLKIPLDKIVLGPLQHTTLPDALVLRIRVVYEVLKEHHDCDIAEWIVGFQHDMHPEREVRIWEGIASAYKAMNTPTPLSPKKREDLFKFLLSCTTTDPEDALRGVRHLTRDEVKRAIKEHGKAWKQLNAKEKAR